MLPFLASELIFEILNHFLPELQLSVTEPYLFPWYLGQICSVWRRIFISSPQFWSNIKIDMDVPHSHVKNFTDKHSSQVIELLKLALEQSGRCPLFLSITMHLVFGSSSLAMCSTEALEMLISHSMRWKYLCICLSPECWSTLSGAKGRLPILRSLKVPCRQYFFLDIFMDATQLTRISFGCIIDWRINWSLVTELHLINTFTLDEAISIIRQTSVLEKLVIDVFDWKTCPNLSTSVTVHLPSLKELYISTPVPLEYLRTPRLEVLQIGLCHERLGGFVINSPSSRKSLAATLSDYFRTVCNLKKLEIYAPDQEDAQLIFEVAPISIQELKLHENRISRQLSLVGRYPNLHNIKTISVVTMADHISGMVSNWVIPFKQLAQFSLDIGQVKDHEVQVLKRLKNIFEERGIKFVNRIVTDHDLREEPMHSVF